MAVFSITEILPSVTNLLIILFTLTLLTVYYFKHKNSYWRRRGVPQLKPALFFGDTKDFALHRVPAAFEFQRLYKEFRDHKFGGFYRFTRPTLLLCDPELIRTVFIKNFSNFHDRSNTMDEEVDPLSANLFNLTGQRWKNIRAKLVPTFSGAKLRLMQDLMRDCMVELDEHLTTKIGDGATVLNIREVMTKFMIDVIGSFAFGIRCNSISDDKSEFRRICKLIFKLGYRVYIRNFLRIIDPRFIRLFNVKILSAEVEEFFMSVLHEAVKHRETEAGRKRTDFLQLMIDLQAEERKQLERNGHAQENGNKNHAQENGNKNHAQQNGNGKEGFKEAVSKSSAPLFTDNVVASNAFVFFAGGFDATSTTLVFFLYELALNPDICDKVRDEIDRVKRAHNGCLDYDAMKELVYLDMVILETLRKYPSASVTGRRCTESFQIPGTSVVIEKGTTVDVSIYGLHHDPQYFPDPDKFLPERFSKENKEHIVPGTYFPFGDGPRMCIAMRFVHFAMRTALADIVSNYNVEPCDKTSIPLKFDPKANPLRPLGGVYLKMEKRSKS